MASRSKVHPSYKTRYRVTNWPECDKGLVERGSLTVWLSPDAFKMWTPRSNGRRGGQRRYSDNAIALAFQLRLVFRLPWRQTEGLLRSLFDLLKLDLDVPDHTTLSRRSRALRIRPAAKATSRPIHLIIDATGLEVFGQGEWARAKHGSQGAHVGWRKLHLGVDGHGFIVTAEKVTTDGSCNHRKVWQVVDGLGARGIIALHRGAIHRNRHLRLIRKVGRARWRRDSGQHEQAKVENAIGRFNKIFGPTGRRGINWQFENRVRHLLDARHRVS